MDKLRVERFLTKDHLFNYYFVFVLIVFLASFVYFLDFVPITGFQLDEGGGGNSELPYTCNNAICESSAGENYINCPTDCPAPQTGSSNPDPPKNIILQSQAHATVSESTASYSEQISKDFIKPTDSGTSTSSSGTSSTGSSSSSTSSYSGSTQTTTTTTSKDICPSQMSIEDCYKELDRINNLINSAYYSTKDHYDSILPVLNKYSSSSELDNNFQRIKSSLDKIQLIRQELLQKASIVKNELIIDAKETAQKKLNFINQQNSNNQRISVYYQTHKSDIPQLNAKPTLSQSTNCLVPIQGLIFAKAISSTGITSLGESCSLPSPPLMPLPPLTNPASQSLPSNTPLSDRISSTAFYVGEVDEWGNSEVHEAIAFAKNDKGVLNIGFLLAPSHSALEQKITQFTRNLLFGQSSIYADSLTGAYSPSNIEPYSNYSRPVPWFLWLALIFLALPFILLSSFILFDQSYLISKGNKYILRGEFASAVKVYDYLVSIYDSLDSKESEPLKQKIIQYKIALIRALDDSSVNYRIIESSDFPKIELSSKALSFMSHESRVEKLINDTMKEIPKNKNLALKRMEIITSSYNNLDSVSKKRLAPKYESLVYSLRN